MKIGNCQINDRVPKLLAVFLTLALLLWLLLWGVGRFVIPRVVDLEEIRTGIIEGFDERGDFRLGIQELQVRPTVFQGLKVRLVEVSVSDQQGLRLGHIPVIDVYLRYWPLITEQRMEMSTIHLQRLALDTKSHNIQELIETLTADVEEEQVKMLDTTLLVSDFTILDHHLPNQQLPLDTVDRLRIKGRQLVIHHLESDQPITLKTYGQIFFYQGLELQVNPQYYVYLKFAPGTFDAEEIDHRNLLAMDIRLDGRRLGLNLAYKKDGKDGVGTLSAKNAHLELVYGMINYVSYIVDIPFTKALNRVLLSGIADMDLRYRFDLENLSKFPVLNGTVRLKEFAYTDPEAVKAPLFSNLEGTFQIKDNLVTFPGVRFSLDDNPFRLKGSYHLVSQRLDLTVSGRRMRIQALFATANRLAQRFDRTIAKQLQDMNLAGVVDFQLRLFGKYPQPLDYEGRIQIRNGRYHDRRTNLTARSISGTIHLNRQIRLENLRGLLGGGRFTVNGRITKDFKRLNLNVFAQNLNLRLLQDTLIGRFPQIADALGNSRIQAGQADVRLKVAGRLPKPDYSGTIRLGEVRFYYAPSSLLVSGITGNVLVNDQVRLQDIRAQLGSGSFQINGVVDKWFETVNVRVTSQNVWLEPFYNTVLAKIPAIQEALGDSQIQAGLADVDLRVSGRLADPALAGQIRLDQVAYFDATNQVLVEDVTGVIALAAREIRLQNITGRLGTGLFTLSGHIAQTFDTYDLSLVSQNLDLREFEESVLSRIPALEDALTELNILAGVGDIQLLLRSGQPITGEIVLRELQLGVPDLPTPLDISALVLGLRDGQVVIEPTQVELGPIILVARGQAFLDDGRFELRANSEAIPVSILREEPHFFMELTGLPLPEVWNTAGSFSLGLLATSETTRLEIGFNDAGLSWQGAAFPVYNVNGLIHWVNPTPGGTPAQGEPEIQTENFSLRYGNSDIVLNGRYNGKADVIAAGVLSPLLVNHYLTFPRATYTPYYESVPFSVEMAGEPTSLITGQGEMIGRLYLDLTRWLQDEGVVSSQVQGEGAQTLSNETQITRPTPPAAPGGNDHAYLYADLAWVDEALLIEQAQLHLMEIGNVMLEGQVSNLFGVEPLTYDVRLLTNPPLDLSLLGSRMVSDAFKSLSGTVAAELVASNSEEAIPHMNGWIEMNGVRIPEINIENLSGEAVFEGRSARYDFPSFVIPGVSLSAKATTDNVFQNPQHLDNVEIQGTSFNVEAFQMFVQDTVDKVIAKQVIDKFIRPWQEGDPVIPVEFTDAELTLSEVIYQNIIMEDYTSHMSLYANGYFELRDVRLKAAEGDVSGYLSMNPMDNNFLALDLRTEGVRANALTRALLNISNQIFGDITSTIQFTTQGVTDEETLRNANGTVNFLIENGRLPAIARIETLLTAANVVRGGILGLNLNNLFRTLQPFETNYFAEMSGDLLIAEKNIYTDNLLSNGENLDLLVQGKINMDNGLADMVINGQMSQDVSGALGALGRFSIGRLFRFIPGLGTWGQDRPGLIYRLPGLGYTPGLGGPAGRFSRFRVELEGPVDDPASLHNFRWLPSTTIEAL